MEFTCDAGWYYASHVRDTIVARLAQHCVRLTASSLPANCQAGISEVVVRNVQS
jgi:hypothetical protein